VYRAGYRLFLDLLFVFIFLALLSLSIFGV
jgi:hypothetical protein